MALWICAHFSKKKGRKAARYKNRKKKDKIIKSEIKRERGRKKIKMKEREQEIKRNREWQRE